MGHRFGAALHCSALVPCSVRLAAKHLQHLSPRTSPGAVAMGKKRWNPPKGNSASDAIQKRKETGITISEHLAIAKETEKVRGSAALHKWEQANTEGDVDDEIFRMHRDKAMVEEARKIAKKVEKANKKKDKKE